MVLHYLLKVDSDTAPDGAQPCVSCMGSQCERVGAPRAEMMIASMTAINARAAITRDGERRNVFMMNRVIGSFGLRQARRVAEGAHERACR